MEPSVDPLRILDRDGPMVVLAGLVESYSAAVAIELVHRVRAASARRALYWLGGGALAVGSGLWSATLLGLLAVRWPIEVRYEGWPIAAAWVVALATVGGGLAFSRLRGLVPGVLLPSLWSAAGLWALQALTLHAVAPHPPMSWIPLRQASAFGAALVAGLLLFGHLASVARGTHAPSLGRPVRRGRYGPAAAIGVVLLVAQSLAVAGLGWNQVATPAPVEGSIGAMALRLLAIGAAVGLLTIGLLASALDARMQSETHELTRSLQAANDELHRIAYLDPLTGLPNRNAFEDRLRAEVARCDREQGRMAVFFIDLDGFKPVNDTYGHPAGDAVLRQIGQRLKDVARGADALARVGGDEFLMLLDGPADTAAAAAAAQRVMDAVCKSCVLLDREVQVSCSIGIAFYPNHGPREKLIANADAAMYTAKRSGGSTFAFFETSMEVDHRDQLALLKDLRSALDNRDLELYYQPKIHAVSGQITGCEALIRWRHPTRGMISPATFIPIAERFGLIGSLGGWVIEEACRQSRVWLDHGLRMRVAVNLSMQQLRQDDLVDRIHGALIKYHVEPALLTFEITESVAMEDAAAAEKSFGKLARIGVALSIDDFGTGYSSLSYLRKLPAKQLKIDRSFINDLGTSSGALAVVDAVVRLAHALGLKVVAEGVETERQRQLLLELECDELQGYLFAKPMSAIAMTLWAMDGDGPTQLEFRPSIFEVPAGIGSPGRGRKRRSSAALT